MRGLVGAVLAWAVLFLLSLTHVEARPAHARLLPEEEALPPVDQLQGAGDGDDDEDEEDTTHREVLRIHEYGRRFVRKRIECDDSELTLISSHKHVLWYSEDGATKKRFRSRGYDAQGYEITRELPLRLGENWHLAFTRDRGSLRPPETHYLTVFQHLVDQKLTVTHHTWQPTSHNASATSGPVPESPFVAAEDESLITTFVSTLSSLFNASSSSGKKQTRCQPIKAATFNIWNFNEPWQKRLKMINEHMMKVQPDVVRYDIGRGRRAQVEQLINLPAFKGYQFVWERAMTYLSFSSDSWHVDEGVAIFSRFPIVHTDHRVLSREMNDGEDKDHQRVCLRARIRPPGCRDLDFLVTHLTLSNRAREKAVLEIVDWVSSFSGTSSPQVPFVFNSHPSLSRVDKESASAVLVGDLNTEPSSRSIELLLTPPTTSSVKRVSFKDAWLALHPTANSPYAANDERGLSFPTWKPRKRIDFVLVKQEEAPMAVEILDMQLLGNVTLPSTSREDELHRLVSSDHLGLWVLLGLPPSPSPSAAREPPRPLAPPASRSDSADELYGNNQAKHRHETC